MHPLANTAVAIGTAGLACGAWAYAAMWPESQIFGPVLIAGNDPSEAVLTFDDGPNGDTTLRLIEILARHNAPATFFLIGRYVRQQPEIVRAIAAAGHAIGNHTMTHPWLHLQPTRRIHEELTACNQALEDTLGIPVRFFRPPHGSRRPEVLRFARSLGLITVNWNVVPEDWKPQPPEALVERIEQGIARTQSRRRGANILLHDGGDRSLDQPRAATLSAVDALLTRFAQRAIRPVTIADWA